MEKEIRKDLYTQSAYAKKVKKTPSWINQQIKAGTLNVVYVNGGVLIKSK